MVDLGQQQKRGDDQYLEKLFQGSGSIIFAKSHEFFFSLLWWKDLMSCQLHDSSKQKQLLLKWAILLGIFKLSLGVSRF